MEQQKHVDTRNLSGDYTRITNDLLRYGAQVCGSANLAYLVCVLLSYEFGKFGNPVSVSQKTLGHQLGKSAKQVGRDMKKLESKHIIKIIPGWYGGKRRNRYVIEHENLSARLANEKQKREEQMNQVPKTDTGHRRGVASTHGCTFFNR